ncbi:MAG TPA: LysE family translocator [Panacibacter sp.]|nr:LysE family translocator [Panacibacter sp.]HNP44186.1 LysE family translocator [Panacibacter sp.]
MVAALAKGLALGLILSISVGPVIFSIIKHSLNNGHKGGFAFIAGVSSSDITIVLACNLFSSLFESAITHEVIIGISGSAFLIIMGIYTIFFKKVTIADKEALKLKTMRRREILGVYLSGYFMNLLNPGVMIFWIAASATILADSKQQPDPAGYRVIVFAICLLVVLLADAAKVMLAGNIREKLNPHNIHIINRIAGIIYIGFGVAIIYGILTNKITQ